MDVLVPLVKPNKVEEVQALADRRLIFKHHKKVHTSSNSTITLIL
jgi:hypothetical protein